MPLNVNNAEDQMQAQETSVRPIPPLPSFRYAKTQEAAEALVTEALEDFPPSPDFSMRANSVRVLAGMWNIQGSMNFPRGWITPAMKAFIALRVDCPNARCWRSYRADMAENPGQFLNTPGVPVEILRQLEFDLMGE